MESPYLLEVKCDQDDRIIEKTETVAGAPVVWAFAYDKEGLSLGLFIAYGI